jgi:UDP-N-acetylglucosamine diphosphorylase/glucosamine-1-phosphate N-acetyltransferase
MFPLILFEDHGYVDLLPTTYWHTIAGLLCGRKTLLDNAAFALGRPVSGLWTRDWIADVAAMRFQTPVNKPIPAGAVLVNCRWLLTGPVDFRPGPFVAMAGDRIAYISCDARLAEALSPAVLQDAEAARRILTGAPRDEIEAEFITYPWDLVLANERMLKNHWTGDDRSMAGKVSSSAYLIDADYIHVGERTEIRPTAVLDASRGPVYISSDVLVDVHTIIEGPAYIGPGTVVKPHSHVRPGTTLGPFCKVSGEVSQSILSGYSNKQHYGFLGNAYVGSWVNLGAGTTNSNLKNTYSPVTVQLGGRTIATQEIFLGCTIGDLARLGIGQLVPTGAVIGFGTMVATGGFSPRFVPSLGWVTAGEPCRTEVGKLIETARTMMARRKIPLLPQEEALLRALPGLIERYGV